jgi:hypothetical protein
VSAATDPTGEVMNPILAALVQGERATVLREADGTFRADAPLPAAILPGSFNPLHEGHLLLASVARQILGVPVAFELSLVNVDKPELEPDEVLRRLEAFRGVASVWLTRAATFERKATLFPGCAFVVGYDTAVRLVDARYCGGDGGVRDAMLEQFRAAGHRFVVGGRCIGGSFRIWNNEELRSEWRDLFVPLGEEAFRVDRSSTELRNR